MCLVVDRALCCCDHSLRPIFLAKPRRCLCRMPGGGGKGGGAVLLAEYKGQKF